MPSGQCEHSDQCALPLEFWYKITRDREGLWRRVRGELGTLGTHAFARPDRESAIYRRFVPSGQSVKRVEDAHLIIVCLSGYEHWAAL